MKVKSNKRIGSEMWVEKAAKMRRNEGGKKLNEIQYE